MLFTLEVLPAAEGDCLILHWGDRRVALIDGGPARTYEDRLRPRLLEIRSALGRECLVLDLVIVSHVDNDHIVGVKKLFAELKAEVERGEPEARRPLRVERLWHNTFADVLGAPQVAAQGSLTASAADLNLILAGQAEGRALRDAHRFLADSHLTGPLNAPLAATPGSLITTQSAVNPSVIEDLRCTILGPSSAETAKLNSAFDKYLIEHGYNVAAALAAVAGIDSSPTNLSSLVCLLDHGGKRILLTGDARGDKIVDGLAEAGLLQDGVIHVDILKVPHHGSARNTSAAFFRAVQASTYVISADGKHGNPEPQTLTWLIETRASTEPFRLVFTYPVAELDATRQRLQRSPWCPETDSIAVLLAAAQVRGVPVTWSEGGCRLDLGDEAAA
jgi:hypothetical protein